MTDDDSRAVALTLCLAATSTTLLPPNAFRRLALPLARPGLMTAARRLAALMVAFAVLRALGSGSMTVWAQIGSAASAM